ncbi:penicillin-binding protein 2 [Phenylobacterium sp.]|uniref:penicillin-binding protein 2 n=1 Tax=Phenylobacterium sp. TaxID=1871053 RepID=UPI002735BE53|nr:penicillin-binding protein 2 [Phenylobacterium sp.]MDP3660989.1 penicillin-binding protein 2 [Phenylobacterium sp.]
MSQPSLFYAEVNEKQAQFHRRAFLIGGVAGIGLVALGARLAQLQVLDTQRYQKLSASNQFNFHLAPPPRGIIVDRNGVVLASNRPNFRLLVVPEPTLDAKGTLTTLQNFVPLDPDRQKRLLKEIARTPRGVPVVVAEDMSWDQFSAINIREPEMPGVTADMGEVRVYPSGAAFAHVIGYVAKVTREDLTPEGPNADPILLHPGFRIGRQGVEKAFDLDLRGKPGAHKVEVDSGGREVRQDPEGDIPATPGKEIRLTLDADIQNRALEVFGEESGAAVMMDCRTGDVLCLFSAPSFDANRFVKGLRGADYRALAQYERKPLFNKALTATYPPGSTFKTLVALTALEHGISPQTTHHCGGAWPWGGRVWHCDRSHGTVDMHDAIKTSCDIYFYQTALAVGPDAIASTARKFGLGQIFDIGIPGQKHGLVPDTAYKRRNFPKDPVWHPGETPSFGIGQGYLNVNALQLCVMVLRLANGAKAIEPRLIRSIGGVERPPGGLATDLGVAKEHLDLVRAAMASVANDAGGTGFLASQLGLGDVKMAGKTGTAQSHTYKGGSRATLHLDWAWRDHAWFVAFAPYDDPRYAISVLVEHGGWGASAAAPRARELMRIALLKDPEVRARIEHPLPIPPLPATPDDDGARPDDPTVIAGRAPSPHV